MAIAISLDDYLSAHNIKYKVVRHRRTMSSLDSSCSAHVPKSQVAKAIVLQSNEGDYLMATLPVNHRLSLNRVNKLTARDYHMIEEKLLPELFPDCQHGAIPAIGVAYDINTLVDDQLLNAENVYIEAGDHRHLVRLNHRQFATMLSAEPHGDICGAVLGTPKLAEHLSSEWRLS